MCDLPRTNDMSAYCLHFTFRGLVPNVMLTGKVLDLLMRFVKLVHSMKESGFDFL